MSSCGHEIHVSVDCFSVKPLGLRPGGFLFYPLVNLLIRRPSWDSGVPSGMTSVLPVESLVNTPMRPAIAIPAAIICSASTVSIVAPQAVASAISPSHVERSFSREKMYVNIPSWACQKGLRILTCSSSSFLIEWPRSSAIGFG